MHTATDEQERIAQFWVPLQMHCGDTVIESDPYFDTMLLDDYHIHISLYSTNLKTTSNAIMIVSHNIGIKASPFGAYFDQELSTKGVTDWHLKRSITIFVLFYSLGRVIWQPRGLP